MTTITNFKTGGINFSGTSVEEIMSKHNCSREEAVGKIFEIVQKKAQQQTNGLKMLGNMGAVRPEPKKPKVKRSFFSRLLSSEKKESQEGITPSPTKPKARPLGISTLALAVQNAAASRLQKGPAPIPPSKR